MRPSVFLLFGLLLPLSVARAQFPATPSPVFPGATPYTRPLIAAPTPVFSGFHATPAPNAEPDRDIPLLEKPFDQLSNQKLSAEGRAALAIEPTKWHHAETDNWIIHYRRVTEARKVAREVEYNLWFVANATLGAPKERYAKKSHLYVFEDEAEWKKFLEITKSSMQWAASFAYGEELFLNLRGGGNSGFGASFDSHTLAHETTHAVIARLYPRNRWPLWLNEGFAEYMGSASVAARKHQTTKRLERNLSSAEIPLAQLVMIDSYPNGEREIQQLYQSSEKFVRFLMTELPKERITKFVDATLSGTDVKQAILTIYPDRIKDWDQFEKRYARFTK